MASTAGWPTARSARYSRAPPAAPARAAPDKRAHSLTSLVWQVVDRLLPILEAECQDASTLRLTVAP